MPEDSAIFRHKVEPEIPQESGLSKPAPVEVGRSIQPTDKIGEDTPIEKLELWEGEKNKKYVNEYFNTHNIAHEFTWKMPLSQIDKYVREEMDIRGYEKTVSNYRDLVAEIEAEIGSSKLELQKRLHRIAQYIQVTRKFNALREKKESYKDLFSRPVSS
jgi:hypothetical protein